MLINLSASAGEISLDVEKPAGRSITDVAAVVLGCGRDLV